MARLERTKNAVYGSVWGGLEKGLSIVLPFVVRTVLIDKLGSEYLGLNSLFSAILQVLNMTELGFGSAAVFAMYRPIAEDKHRLVGAILNYLKKIYRTIGWCVMVGGLCLLPFLKLMIKGNAPEGVNIYCLYIIYLFNSACSYWLYAYKNLLLLALQMNKITNVITLITNGLMYILQIVVLLTLSNYYIYIALMPCFTIASNVVSSYIVKKKFSQWTCKDDLDEENKSIIIKRIIPLISTKVAVVLVNSADTLVISAALGLRYVAIYNNYYYILSAVSGFLIVIYSSMQSGIGNSLIMDSKDKILRDFDKFCFLNNWLVTLCTVCMACLYQPFMRLWMGEKLMLSNSMVGLFSIYFYANNIQRIVVVYKDAAGIWKEDMARCYISCALNLLLNVISVRYIGLYGVIGSSVVANLLGLPIMAYILYKKVFKEEVKKFYLKEIEYFMLMIVITIVIWKICNCIILGGIGELILKFVVCIVCTNVALVVFWGRTKEFKSMSDWIKSLLYKGKMNDYY